jgi:Ca2+-binding EF-hand superfamily protein
MGHDGPRWLLALVAVLVLAGAADAQRRRTKSQPGAEPRPVPAAPREPELPIYLPGFDQAAKDAKKPAGPPKAKVPPKPEPPKPDPMKEADQVTAAADHLSELELALAEVLREHFRVCDLDSSGWLSLRECEVTLSLERAEFRRMDRNQDGRLDEAEFSAEGELLLARLGAVPVEAAPRTGGAEPPLESPVEEPAGAVPAPLAPEPRAPPAKASEPGSMAVRPADLLGRYDADASEGIDAPEIEQLFGETGLVLSPELVIAQMDTDDSGELEVPELAAIAWLASKYMPESLRPAPAVAGAVQPERPRARAALLPTHFTRLDPGRDGFIDEADLRALQSPARLDLRFRALLSAMDRDGDGRLSEAEFRASMGVGAR